MAVQAHQYSSASISPQDWFMDFGSGGGGFCDFYPLQQYHQQQLQQQQQQQQIEAMMRNQNQTQIIGGQVVDPSDTLGGYQIQEIDRLIALQNERLRLALQQQRKQQLTVLIHRLEAKAQSILKQKEDDIAKAARKGIELEECIRKVEMENQAWQRVAKENESMVVALNNTIQQVRENVSFLSTQGGGGGGAEDAESCCQSNASSSSSSSHRHDEEEEIKLKKEKDERKKMVCKGCNSGKSCVLFLPCRHLCSCKSCEPFLGSCPVCKTVKKACIEVFMV